MSLMGWQIFNSEGFSVHGDDDDPFGLASFEVLTGEAADIAQDWCDRNEGYYLRQIFEGDIEEPTIVSGKIEVKRPAADDTPGPA